MAKDLELKGTLPISDANEGLLTLIAKKKGWTETRLLKTPDEKGNPTEPMTAEEFVCQFLLKKMLEDYFNTEVDETFEWAYGILQSDAKVRVLEQLNEELVVTAEIKNRQ